MPELLRSLDFRGYLDLCYKLALESPCSKAKRGAVVVQPQILGDAIVGRGFNHSPNPEYADCATLCAGKLRAGIKSGTRVELCYAIHAEQKAIIEAGQYYTRGSTLVVAGYNSDGTEALKDPNLPEGHPMRGFYCSMCARMIWAAGIDYIVCDSVYGIPVLYSPQDIWESSYIVADSIERTA